MAYRLYIGKMSRADMENLKTMSEKEIFDKYSEYPEDDIHIPGPYTFVECVHEFGSGVDFVESVKEISGTTDLFGDDYDYDFCEINKDGLEHIIDHYSEKTSNYYKQLLESLTVVGSDTSTLERWLNRRAVDWFPDGKALGVLDKTDNPHQLTSSWDYEYNVFSLLAIFKTFDWEKDALMFYGY